MIFGFRFSVFGFWFFVVRCSLFVVRFGFCVLRFALFLLSLLFCLLLFRFCAGSMFWIIVCRPFNKRCRTPEAGTAARIFGEITLPGMGLSAAGMRP